MRLLDALHSTDHFLFSSLQVNSFKHKERAEESSMEESSKWIQTADNEYATETVQKSLNPFYSHIKCQEKEIYHMVTVWQQTNQSAPIVRSRTERKMPFHLVMPFIQWSQDLLDLSLGFFVIYVTC